MYCYSTYCMLYDINSNTRSRIEIYPHQKWMPNCNHFSGKYSHHIDIYSHNLVDTDTIFPRTLTRLNKLYKLFPLQRRKLGYLLDKMGQFQRKLDNLADKLDVRINLHLYVFTCVYTHASLPSRHLSPEYKSADSARHVLIDEILWAAIGLVLGHRPCAPKGN